MGVVKSSHSGFFRQAAMAVIAVVGVLVSLYIMAKEGIIGGSVGDFLTVNNVYITMLTVTSILIVLVGIAAGGEDRELGIVISLVGIILFVICCMAMTKTDITTDETAIQVGEYLESEYNLELVDFIEETEDGYIYAYCSSLGDDGTLCEVYLLGNGNGSYSAYSYVGGEYYLLEK